MINTCHWTRFVGILCENQNHCVFITHGTLCTYKSRFRRFNTHTQHEYAHIFVHVRKHHTVKSTQVHTIATDHGRRANVINGAGCVGRKPLTTVTVCGACLNKFKRRDETWNLSVPALWIQKTYVKRVSKCVSSGLFPYLGPTRIKKKKHFTGNSTSGIFSNSENSNEIVVKSKHVVANRMEFNVRQVIKSVCPPPRFYLIFLKINEKIVIIMFGRWLK